MIKIVLTIIIVLILILGLRTIFTELYYDFRGRKVLLKKDKRFKILLSFIGSGILFSKIDDLLQIIFV